MDMDMDMRFVQIAARESVWGPSLGCESGRDAHCGAETRERCMKCFLYSVRKRTSLIQFQSIHAVDELDMHRKRTAETGELLARQLWIDRP